MRFKVFPAENAVRNRSLVEAIGETEDHSMFIAWHPKQEFPYEFTRELPKSVEQNNQTLLKEEQIKAVKRAAKLQRPEFSRAELAKLTSTTVSNDFF
jgi:hypothetical protein